MRRVEDDEERGRYRVAVFAHPRREEIRRVAEFAPGERLLFMEHGVKFNPVHVLACDANERADAHIEAVGWMDPD